MVRHILTIFVAEIHFTEAITFLFIYVSERLFQFNINIISNN